MKPKNPKETSLTEIENFAAAELNSFIRTFYAEVRLDEWTGSYMQNVLWITLRYGLQFSISVEWKKIDIVNDTQFKEANEMFHAMLVKLKVKQAGKGSVTHKDPISKTKEDFLKIKSSTSSVLDVDTPAGLQNKMYLCRQFDITDIALCIVEI